MPELLDSLDLPRGGQLAITADDGRLAAVPQMNGARVTAGGGAAEALLDLLAQGSRTQGSFTVQSWTQRTAVGERAVGVDQTNESVIVGDAAVVKWATHLEAGPHPAPRRISVLRDAGFAGMPTPWGLITWRSPTGDQTLVASVDDYLPDAVDGWTWAPELITTATLSGDHTQVIESASAVGDLIANLHVALARTACVATAQDAARWHAEALRTLDIACASGESASITLARRRRTEIETMLTALGSLSTATVIEGHGDLHVGQILRSGQGFVVTDFDGNPVLPPEQRILPIPAAQDVAGMVQSLAHAAIVARRYTEMDDTALADTSAAAQHAFLTAYSSTTAIHELYDPAPLQAFRVQQVLREIIYAARHLPRWMYVPDAALPALLDERT